MEKKMNENENITKCIMHIKNTLFFGKIMILQKRMKEKIGLLIPTKVTIKNVVILCIIHVVQHFGTFILYMGYDGLTNIRHRSRFNEKS